MLGFDPNATRGYVVKDEQELPTEEQTVFQLKNLTVRQTEILKNSIFSKSGHGKKAEERLMLGTQERQALEMGLVGWDNFNDQSGNMIIFSKENLDFIPAKYRSEIAAEIRGENELTEGEEKN